MSRSLEDIRAVVALCAYPGFDFKVDADKGSLSEISYPWFQIICPEGVDTRSGEPLPWKARKWKLSYHMTDTEIVQTVWAAVQRALLHEACELFRFKGAAIYDRHVDVHALAALVSQPNILDGREEPFAR